MSTQHTPHPVDPRLSYVDLSLPETDYECTVGYEYSPSEAMTLEYPGCPADVEVCEVWVNGADIAAVLHDRVIEVLVENVFEAIDAQVDDAKAAEAEDRAFYARDAA